MLSVNGKGGTVRLNALDVWALPRPVSPKVGQLVRVVKVDASTGALTVDTISTDSLSGLGSEEKELLLKLRTLRCCFSQLMLRSVSFL